MKELYIEHNFGEPALELIANANAIIAEYQRQGLRMTLRQLYYQFVARNLFANTKSNYNLLSRTMVYARDAGVSDWDAMEDRTRELVEPATWASPRSFLAGVVDQYAEDLWASQSHRPEVWVEKDALLGVVAAACGPWRVPYFSTRGNCGQLPARDAGLRFSETLELDQVPVVLHLADHDPTGIEMTEDVRYRMELYAGQPIEVKRIALNMAQVRRYRPPPNFAKEKDANLGKYRRQFGTNECWELDALAPNVITSLIGGEIKRMIDEKKWAAAARRERRSRRLLSAKAREMT